jgi:1-acyl-sn-glycerol-3-phosphate acyltransferase
MEKFNFWADPFTQIHPFLPPSPKQQNTVWWLLSWIFVLLLSPLILIKLLLIGINFLGLWLIEKMSPFLPRAILRILHIVVCRILLTLLGFWSIESRFQTQKKTQRSTPGASIGNGHLIISNNVSYLDLIFLLYQYSPVFVYPPNSWKDQVPREGLVQKKTFFEALSDVIYQPKRPANQCHSSLQSIRDEAKIRNQGPIVLFPEGTTTNGQVLLGCSNLINLTKPVIPLIDIHILSFVYQDQYAIYTVGSFAIHLLKLSSHFSNQLKVQHIPDEDIQAIVMDNDGQTLEDKLLSLLASNSKIRKGKIMANKKHEFNEYWYTHKNEYKKK